MVINILYSIKLKQVAVIDIFIIAIGFVIRLFVGSVVTNIKLSTWIILMTFLLALFLALAKRRDDLVLFLENGDKIRPSIDGYNIQTLDASLIMMASVSVVSYIMYTVSPEVISRSPHTDKLYTSVFFVLLGLIRYFDIIFIKKGSGSPTKVILKDRLIQFSVIGWFLTLFLFLYLLK